jgi:hypothetical protein
LRHPKKYSDKPNCLTSQRSAKDFIISAHPPKVAGLGMVIDHNGYGHLSIMLPPAGAKPFMLIGGGPMPLTFSAEEKRSQEQSYSINLYGGM